MDERTRWEREYDARQPVEADFPDQESYRAAFQAWDEEWERLDELMTAGALCLGHQGCGYYTWLVVTGPDSGTIWTDLRAGDGPIEPLTDGLHPLGFQAWYLSWLDRAESEAHGVGRAPRE